MAQKDHSNVAERSEDVARTIGHGAREEWVHGAGIFGLEKGPFRGSSEGERGCRSADDQDAGNAALRAEGLRAAQRQAPAAPGTAASRGGRREPDRPRQDPPKMAAR